MSQGSISNRNLDSRNLIEASTATRPRSAAAAESLDPSMQWRLGVETLSYDPYTGARPFIPANTTEMKERFGDLDKLNSTEMAEVVISVLGRKPGWSDTHRISLSASAIGPPPSDEYWSLQSPQRYSHGTTVPFEWWREQGMVSLEKGSTLAGHPSGDHLIVQSVINMLEKPNSFLKLLRFRRRDFGSIGQLPTNVELDGAQQSAIPQTAIPPGLTPASESAEQGNLDEPGPSADHGHPCTAETQPVLAEDFGWDWYIQTQGSTPYHAGSKAYETADDAQTYVQRMIGSLRNVDSVTMRRCRPDKDEPYPRAMIDFDRLSALPSSHWLVAVEGKEEGSIKTELIDSSTVMEETRRLITDPSIVSAAMYRGINKQ